MQGVSVGDDVDPKKALEVVGLCDNESLRQDVAEFLNEMLVCGRNREVVHVYTEDDLLAFWEKLVEQAWVHWGS